ncbi:hypothetical protein DOY81_004653 [Sarcophaga bullata]|nr:hypothetical protein DOY81_004653 [Sarcophaga bullata]
MDLLCTENIMNEYGTEIVCLEHQQQQQPPHSQTAPESEKLPKTHTIIDFNEEQQQSHIENDNDNNTNIIVTTTTSPPSLLYSSSSSLLCSSTTSCCPSTNSSGYNSSSSSTCSTSSSCSSSLSSSKNSLISSSSSITSSSSSSSSSVPISNICYNSSKLQCDEDSNDFVDNIYESDHKNTKSSPSATTASNQHHHQQQHQQPQQPQQPQQNNTVFVNKLINHSLDYVNTATEDPTFLTDRCLENALKAEEKRPQPICTYFKTVQKDITPPMRKIVAEWMMENIVNNNIAIRGLKQILQTHPYRKLIEFS